MYLEGHRNIRGDSGYNMLKNLHKDDPSIKKITWYYLNDVKEQKIITAIHTKAMKHTKHKTRLMHSIIPQEISSFSLVNGVGKQFFLNLYFTPDISFAVML